MYNIDPKFLNADGTINNEAAMAAGRKARTRAAGVGFKTIYAIARDLFRAGNQISSAVNQKHQSHEGAKS